MATFTIDSKKLTILQEKYKVAAETYKAYAIGELNKAVDAMQVQAAAKAGNLPYLPTKAKVRYERTGNLARSIKSTHYNPNLGYAQLSMGSQTVRYAPYVEFGTGKGFNIPSYKFKMRKPLDSFASQFRGTNLKNYNMPSRPFFFKAFDDKFSSLLQSLKKYKK